MPNTHSAPAYREPLEKYLKAFFYGTGAAVSGATAIGLTLLVHDHERYEVNSVVTRFKNNNLRTFLKEHSEQHYFHIVFAYLFGKKALDFANKARETLSK
jgi:hypothetical protein